MKTTGYTELHYTKGPCTYRGVYRDERVAAHVAQVEADGLTVTVRRPVLLENIAKLAAKGLLPKRGEYIGIETTLAKLVGR